MKRTIWAVMLASVLGVAIAVTPWQAPMMARANSNSSDAGGCGFTGSTWFSAYQVGWGSTGGGPSCAMDAAITFGWYDGSWHYQWAAGGTYWVQRGASPSSSLTGSHNIYVSGIGLGQVIGTSE